MKLPSMKAMLVLATVLALSMPAIRCHPLRQQNMNGAILQSALPYSRNPIAHPSYRAKLNLILNDRQQCIEPDKILQFLELVAEPFLNFNSPLDNIYFPFRPDLDVVDVTELVISHRIVDAFFADSFAFSTESFGVQGEYTEFVEKKYQVLQEFWGVSTSATGPFPLALLGAHGRVLETFMEQAIQDDLLLRGEDTDDISFAELEEVADKAREAITSEFSYDSPVLTLNGVFSPIPRFEDPTRSVIVLGDGIMDFLDYAVHNTQATNETAASFFIGPAAVLAHEYGHYLQYRLSVEDQGLNVERYFEWYESVLSPQFIRQLELEADAMAAYALAHDDGSDLDIELLIKTAEIYAHLGDCDTSTLSHHGTPAQRECAIRWGADTGLDMGLEDSPTSVTSRNGNGVPLTPRQFRERFLKILPDILELNPAACSLTEGESADEEDQTSTTTTATSTSSTASSTTMTTTSTTVAASSTTTTVAASSTTITTETPKPTSTTSSPTTTTTNSPEVADEDLVTPSEDIQVSSGAGKLAMTAMLVQGFMLLFL